MRIVIETDPTAPLQVAAGGAEADAPVASPTDAGAGPSNGPSMTGGTLAAATTAELDAGGPPEWLTAAIARAMSESDADSGETPQTTAGPDTASVEDGGSGPALA